MLSCECVSVIVLSVVYVSFQSSKHAQKALDLDETYMFWRCGRTYGHWPIKVLILQEYHLTEIGLLIERKDSAS